MSKNIIVRIYHKLRENKNTFRIIIRLKEMGVNRVLKDITGINKQVICTASEMEEATVFVQDNKQRIYNMLSVLADDKSRAVWKAVMLYRTKGKAIPKSLWSDNDQYFVTDIIKLQEDEVFVDGGLL